MSKFVSCQGATPLTELGKITTTTEHKPNCVYAAFYVIAGNNGSLFYREASNQLNFVDWILSDSLPLQIQNCSTNIMISSLVGTTLQTSLNVTHKITLSSHLENKKLLYIIYQFHLGSCCPTCHDAGRGAHPNSSKLHPRRQCSILYSEAFIINSYY